MLEVPLYQVKEVLQKSGVKSTWLSTEENLLLTGDVQ